MNALDFEWGESYEIVIVGKAEADDTQAMLASLRNVFLPNKVVLLKPDGDGGTGIDRIAPYTRQMSKLDGKATAYVCRSYACEQPITSVDSMLELLKR
jgi:uncharacterized protein YyaL (SSP411 family)